MRLGNRRSRRKRATVDAKAFGALLLDLYRFARELSLGEFQERVLERLGAELPFDAAWWGMARVGRELELHSSYPYRVGAAFVQHWHRIRDHDILAAAVIARPSTTVAFGSREIRSDAVFADFCHTFGIRQLLCTQLLHPTLNLATFLSLYRTSPTPFSAVERQLKQLVTPHLWAAWTSNWIAQLAAAHAHSVSNHVVLAVADQQATLHAAEPRFSEIMHAEWPAWQGPELPLEVRDALRNGTTFSGTRIVTRLLPASGLYLVEVRERSRLERLTPREFAIAERFGKGKSYKEIAAALPLSPATVRAHLRTIYTKLEISDKTELANLLSAHSDARSLATYN